MFLFNVFHFLDKYMFFFSHIELYIVVQVRNGTHKIQWDHNLHLSVHCFF